MKFGQLHLCENPLDRSEKEIVEEQFDIMVRAEEFGFDSLWPAEHHFSEYGYCASPAVTLAALAMRTKRIRLGTGVVLIAQRNPVVLAKEMASLDVVSGGWLIVGIGAGYLHQEFAALGIPFRERGARTDEAIAVMRSVLNDDRTSLEGRVT